MTLKETMELIELKKSNPKYYQQVLDSLVDIQVDLIKISKKIQEEIEKL